MSKAAENYGYVTSKLTTTKNNDNETVSKLSMWTADGQLTDILADSNLSGKIAKGSVVTYEVNDDGSYTIAVASVNRAAGVQCGHRCYSLHRQLYECNGDQ